MLAKISSRSNSSSDVWRDGDEAVSPPALLCCAAVRESSSACAGDGVARAGDGGGVPSRERRRGDPSVEDGVTDRARRAAARARQARDVFERRAIGHDSRDDSRSAEDVAGRPSLLHWLFDIHEQIGLRGSRSVSGRAGRRRSKFL